MTVERHGGTLMCGDLRAEKVKFVDGDESSIGCCIGYRISEEREGIWIALDFPESDIDAIIELLKALKTEPATVVDVGDLEDE